MQSFFNSLIACVGLAWVVYWWALSRNVKVTARGEPIFSRVSYLVPLVLSGVLVFSPSFPHSVLSGARSPCGLLLFCTESLTPRMLVL